MRAFYELVNEYPWTTILLFCAAWSLLSAIRGEKADD